MRLYRLLLPLCWLFSITCEVEDGVSYMVGAGKKDCFYRDMMKGDQMDFDLQVISGADVDITVSITSPTGKQLLHEVQKTEISSEIKIEEDGVVEICFDNSFSMFSDKVIYFDLGIDEGDSSRQTHYQGLEKDDYENQSEIALVLAGISAKFTEIEQMQAVMRSRYLRHEYLQSRNLWRVTYFSIVSCFTMVVVGLLQVILIRNLFDNKNTRGLQNKL